MLDREHPHELTTRILFARHLPARLNSQQSSVLLGFPESAIPLLIREKLLKPLGGGPKNSVKYFAKVEIESLAADPKWLDKATRATRRVSNSSKLKSSDTSNSTHE